MSQNPLGKTSQYISQYAPELLFAIARSEKREELESNYLAFKGEDIWNAFELSWLNHAGLPQVAIAEFRLNADSEHIIESKSLKLYLNSFNQTQFATKQSVIETIRQDLSQAANSQVSVKLWTPTEFEQLQFKGLAGILIDDAAISIDNYDYKPELLADATDENGPQVEETLVSHLLKSNCLITSQPDWASIQIKYHGSQIEKSALLKYLVSFRSHNEFHEQCVERIFCDIKRYCRPQKLTVYARYTRRGGLDINPWRSDFEDTMANLRQHRQ